MDKVTQLKKEANEFEGARKMSCKEAADLLTQEKVRKAWFRPDGFLSKDPDNDIAFVWLIEDKL